MTKPRTPAEAAIFALFKRSLPLVFLVATVALVVPVLLLEQRFKIEALRALGGMVFLVGLLASVFTAREIGVRMEDDPSMSFSDAFAHTLYRYLTYLCFLPFLGPALQEFLKNRREKNPFTSDDDSERS